MKIRKLLTLLSVPLWLASATFTIGAAAAAERSPPPRAALAPVPGEVIVRFRSDASVLRSHVLAARPDATTVRSVLARRAGSLGQRVGHALEAGAAVAERTQVVRAAGVSAEALAALLRADREVEFAEPNGRRRIAAAPNDPLYAEAAAGVRPNGPDVGQWYLRAPAGDVRSSIDVEAAWAQTRGKAGVVVAVLDTGVRFDHPDLGRMGSGGKLLPGYDFVSNSVVANDGGGWDADPSDPGDWVSDSDLADHDEAFEGCEVGHSSWHGTATASLVGAATHNAIGMAGTAPRVSVLPVRVLGKCSGEDKDIWPAMLWAAGIPVPGVPDNPNPAKVLNLSLGHPGPCTEGYQAVIDQVRAQGVVIIVAAGNGDGQAVEAPANCRGVIAVAALRHVGTKSGFSSLGPEISIAAPGGNCVLTGADDPCLYPVLFATNDGTRGPAGNTWSDSFNFEYGTSFAAPLVAGTASLMLSVNPTLTPDQVRRALRSGARPFPTDGADNGSDPTPVTACHAPDGTEQLQCYCTRALCGAGMLDAGAAVAAAAAFVQPEPEPVDSGGGAMSALWVSLLGAGALSLWRVRPRSG